MKSAIVTALAGALAAGLLGGCERPDEESCREAVMNIREITQLHERMDESEVEAAVRSCRARASPETIRCVREAEDMADLEACEGDLAEEVMDEAEGDDGEADGQGAGDDGEADGQGAGDDGESRGGA